MLAVPAPACTATGDNGGNEENSGLELTQSQLRENEDAESNLKHLALGKEPTDMITRVVKVELVVEQRDSNIGQRTRLVQGCRSEQDAISNIATKPMRKHTLLFGTDSIARRFV